MIKNYPTESILFFASDSMLCIHLIHIMHFFPEDSVLRMLFYSYCSIQIVLCIQCAFVNAFNFINLFIVLAIYLYASTVI